MFHGRNEDSATSFAIASAFSFTPLDGCRPDELMHDDIEARRTTIEQNAAAYLLLLPFPSFSPSFFLSYLALLWMFQYSESIRFSSVALIYIAKTTGQCSCYNHREIQLIDLSLVHSKLFVRSISLDQPISCVQSFFFRGPKNRSFISS